MNEIPSMSHPVTEYVRLEMTSDFNSNRSCHSAIFSTDIPSLSVTPFRPNTNSNLYQNYPDPNVAGPSTRAVRRNPPPAETLSSDERWYLRDFL